MRCDDNGGAAPNYEPNSRGGPVQTGEPASVPLLVSGVGGAQAPAARPGDDDFAQAGALYRLMREEQKTRLVAALAGSLAPVTRPDTLERCLGHFRAADADFGRRLEAALRAPR
jgi:catalase